MRTIHILGILVLLALAVPASPSHAGGVVTVCDEAHLLAALAGGGVVTFACSGTITLTNTITVAADTTIDGSGQAVTISGNNAVRVFTVVSPVTLNLRELTITNGSASIGAGIFVNTAGTLIVSNSTFSGNHAYGLYSDGGGAIFNDAATVIVNNSTFFVNSADYGNGGGIYNGGGLMFVGNATFSSNDASYGGAIYADCQSTLTISNTAFYGNSADYDGGGICNCGTLTVRASSFSGNWANNGGGIVNSGTLTVNHSTFSSNLAFWPWAGGGINNEGTLAVSNSTFYGNSSSYEAGGIFNGRGATAVSNSTLASNAAGYQGGNIRNRSGVVTLTNTIVANSVAGGNCSGDIADGGGNLSYPDTTCPGINGSPLLGPLQNNSGPTLTMDLRPGSAAIDAGNDAMCAAAPVNNRDQRGIVRPQGAHCDIGAVEQYCPSFVPPGTVGVEDIVAIATRWGWTDANPGWDPVYDLNGDNKIDIVDIMLVTRTWGVACS